MPSSTTTHPNTEDAKASQSDDYCPRMGETVHKTDGYATYHASVPHQWFQQSCQIHIQYVQTINWRLSTFGT
ncbi:hypothetical protein Natpe_1934 [Natrinema pellirubrum DSM 15624]|uniref:Uncharacterized protein n=1 Tax=Natrinema pellirubrum (strain DSM 15624 / CIP 106293 / JCM 10476 / NCIMB 786 / 157) TaxID=797303 RepID=L0JMK5_NATP1|nr:hypothetical protein Natpe_1934 [Natrinema pellirubrum DSM 15624]